MIQIKMIKTLEKHIDNKTDLCISMCCSDPSLVRVVHTKVQNHRISTSSFPLFAALSLLLSSPGWGSTLSASSAGSDSLLGPSPGWDSTLSGSSAALGSTLSGSSGLASTEPASSSGLASKV